MEQILPTTSGLTQRRQDTHMKSSAGMLPLR